MVGLRPALFALVAVALTLPADAAPPVDQIMVVVSPKSNMTEAPLDTLRDLFMKRRKTLPDGARAVILNWPAGCDVRVAFDHHVLHMDPDAVARYWTERRIRGQGRPPRSISSPALIRRIVGRNPNVIAYLPAPAVTEEVKVLRTLKVTRPSDAKPCFLEAAK